jgi:plasmid stabilization system protein ParE
MKLEFHPEAELELTEAAAHYGLQVPGLGWRFEAEVRRAIDLLLEQPRMGRKPIPCCGSWCSSGFHRFCITA